MINSFDDMKYINFRFPARGGLYKLQATVAPDLISYFGLPRTMKDYNDITFKQEMIDRFKKLEARRPRPRPHSPGPPWTLKLKFIDINQRRERSIFNGLVTEKDFDIEEIKDIRKLHNRFLEPRKMYRLKTELNVVLYDPRNNSFQERTLYVNVPDPVHLDNFDYFLDELVARYESQIDNIEDVEGSGLQLEKFNGFRVTLTRLSLGGGGANISIPEWVKKKKCVSDINSPDGECFKYAIVASLMWEKFKDKCGQTKKNYKTYKPYIDIRDWTGIPCPTPVLRGGIFKRFEQQNSTVSLTVFQINESDPDDKNMIMYYRGATDRPFKAVILLIIGTGEASEAHFVPVTSQSRLINSNANQNRGTMCLSCQKRMPPEELNKHVKYCGTGVAMPVFPKETCKFEGHMKKVPCPIVIYADTEAIIEKETGKHIPICVSYVEVERRPEKVPVLKRKKTIVGTDCIKIFLEHMEMAARHYSNIYYSLVKPLRPGGEELAKQVKCIACNELASHKWIGTTDTYYCEKCRPSRTIPIYFHNLKGYDGCFIIKKLHELKTTNIQPKIIAKTATGLMGLQQTFLFFGTIVEKGPDGRPHRVQQKRFFSIKLMDSNQLMSGSLAKLASTVTEWSIPLDKPEIQTAKGFFPYEYMDNVDRLQETSLPPREQFYSELTEEGLTEEEYKHAKDVWDALGCKTLQDYMEFYCETDVLLLSNIFENFRDTCLRAYKLDPAHYMSAPGLTWDAMLLYTGNKFELAQEEEQVEFIQRCVRGGISQCSIHHVKTNHPLIGAWDPSKPITEIKYLDANNLYGWAMSQPMPTGGLHWLSRAEIAEGRLGLEVPWSGRCPVWCGEPCFLEVDLDYPPELHEAHSDLPLAPHHYTFTARDKRLITSVLPRENYVLHYRMLEYYIYMGMRLKKIHRALAFEESACLADYIDYNTQMRAKGQTDFEKNFYKLMNNSMFGKTIEDVRKYRDYKFVVNEKQMKKHEPLCKRVTVLNSIEEGDISDSALLELQQKEYRYVKPIYIGATVLELSKLLMYDMHYGYFRPKFPGIRLAYIDTDSFVYSVPLQGRPDKTFNDLVREDVEKHSGNSIYDTSAMSDFPKELRVNKKVIGKFKDEMNGEPILEFIGIRSKVYAFRDGLGKVTKKNKGIKAVCVRKHLKFEDYMQLFESSGAVEPEPAQFIQFVRKAGEIRSERRSKIMMAPNDIKRIQLSDMDGNWLAETRPIGWSSTS